MTDVVLTGPVTLPGDGTPVAGCPVKILLIAGSPRDPGDTGTAAVLGEYATETDADGDFTVTIPAIDADFYPQGAFYAVTVGGTGRFKGYVRKVQPTVAGTFRFTDPDIGGTDLLPPEFTQIDPSTDDIVAAVNDYLAANPFDVSAEVAAELAGHPPLFVDNALSELTANQNQARLNIGAASDTDVSGVTNALDLRIGTQELLEATDPAYRLSNLNGPPVTAPGFGSVQFQVVDGVVSFVTTGDGESDPEAGSFQPLDSDLTAIAALATTSFGRSLLELASAAALRTTIGPAGTPDATTFLRGDGAWSTPSSAVDSVNGQTGDVTLDASDVGAEPVNSDLTAIAALTTTPFGRSVLEAASASALRTLAGLGTAAVAATGDFDAAGAAAAAQAASQPLDSDLTAIAALTTTSTGRSLLSAADAAAIRTIAGAQASDAELTAIAGLTSAADKGIQFTGSGTASTYDLTTAGKALLDDADAAAQRTTLGLGTAATTASTDYDAAGAAAAAQAASQPLDSDLTAIAALTTTSTGRSLLSAADAAAIRTIASAQASDTELTAIAGLTSAADKGIQFTGSGTAGTFDLTTAGKALIDDADASAQRTTLGLGTAATVNTGTSSGDLPLLSTGGRLPIARVASGTPDGTKFVRDDGTLVTPSGSGAVAADVIWDTKGDIAVATGADTAAKLAAGAEGLALVTDPAQTTGLKYAAHPTPMAGLPTSALASTFHRNTPTTSSALQTTGVVFACLIPLRAGTAYTSASIKTGGTAGASLTHSWMGIADTSLAILRVSSDDTTATWNSTTSRTFSFSSYTPTVSGDVYAFIMVAGTTIPTFLCATGLSNNLTNIAPASAGTSSTGQTTPPSLPSSIGSVTAGTVCPYIWMS